MARPIHPVVVGTAGHIDHGKSSLVRALTGIDPDRLKEEKDRGLTIDLGFARYKLGDGRWLGLIDVPGHERFIRNMVAGSTGLDVALLVVAADDGVMPQTREHLDILDLLGVRTGLIALTKIDLVDADTVELAEDEVRELVASTVLEGAQILRVSSETGEGLAELKAALEALALDVEPRPSAGRFRMPVQRVFTLDGIGTVVTGIPLSGRLEPGTELEFLPGGQRAKVRGLHAYGGKVTEAVAGHSTALSVPDARSFPVGRGWVAAEPGVFRSGDAVDIDVRLLPRAVELHHRVPARFHTGTSEIQGQVLLLDREVMRGGEQAVLRVLLDESVSCAAGDRCLLRLQNPVITVGGGVVLRLDEAPRRYRRAALGEELEGIKDAGSRPDARVLHELTQAGPQGRKVADLAALMTIDAAALRELVEGLDDVYHAARGDRLFLRDVVATGERELLESVDKILSARKLAASLVRTKIRTTRSLPSELKEAVLDRLISGGRVRPGSQGRLLFLDRLAPLPAADQARLDRVVEACEARGLRPPTEAEIVGDSGLDAAAVANMLARAVDEVRVDTFGGFFIGTKAQRKALHGIRDNCLAHDGILDIPALRDRLDTSRKYLIPFLEHVDALGLTILRGGVRRLLPDSELAHRLAAERA